MIEYFVNKEKGVVVAKIDVPSHDLVNELTNSLYKSFKGTYNFYMYNIIRSMVAESLMQYDEPFLHEVGESRMFVLTFSGKSKCSPEDGFNEEVGKRLAHKRAKIQLLRFKVRVLKEVTKVVDTLSDAVYDKKLELNDRAGMTRYEEFLTIKHLDDDNGENDD